MTEYATPKPTNNETNTNACLWCETLVHDCNSRGWVHVATGKRECRKQ